MVACKQPRCRTNPREATFAEYEQLVYHTVHAFRRRYGGDWDELLSTTFEAYAVAYNSDAYDPNRARFSTWVRNGVWQALRNARQRVARKAARPHEEPAGDAAAQWAATERPHEVEAVLGAVGPDAAEVLRLVFIDTPADLVKTAEGKGGHSLNWRSTIRDYLRAAGWSIRRISESFEEIADAIAKL